MSNTWVVIPAAGESRRFREAGYTTSKPFLKIESPDGFNAYMVQHVISSLPRGMAVILGVHTSVSMPYLNPEPKHIRIRTTRGQAETVYKVVKTIPDEDRVLVLDCDMIVPTSAIRDILMLLNVYDVVVAVTETFDPNASRVDQIPFPTQFVEKENISQYGIVGARAFRNAKALTESLKRVLDESEIDGYEPYLSTAINFYPGSKYAHMIDSFVDLGTPDRIRESGYKIL